jgi:hypothetical protein
MNYSLGNMLVNGGALNPDGLSLDLQFATDKTLTARKGPTPTFTRASTATFIDSNGLIQSAAINTPRFDHDPTTLASRGLLIEESRTNLVFPSDTLSTQTRTVTATPHTLSFYGTGTIVLSGVHIATVVGTGAYPTRTTLTFTPTAGSLTITVTGSVTQAQLEVGSFPTSYIPTTTASVVRSADVCSITGSNFSGIYNQSSCTVVARFTPSTIAAPASVCGTNDPRDLEIQMTGGGNIAGLSVNSLGATSQLNRSGVAVGANQRFAFASESSNQAVCLNGGTVLASPSWLKSAAAPTLLHIGRAGFGGQYSGVISRLSVYRKRLSNSKLQSLTT